MFEDGFPEGSAVSVAHDPGEDVLDVRVVVPLPAPLEYILVQVDGPGPEATAGGTGTASG